VSLGVDIFQGDLAARLPVIRDEALGLVPREVGIRVLVVVQHVAAALEPDRRRSFDFLATLESSTSEETEATRSCMSASPRKHPSPIKMSSVDTCQSRPNAAQQLHSIRSPCRRGRTRLPGLRPYCLSIVRIEPTSVTQCRRERDQICVFGTS
jgi:hypothetical protein